MAQQTPLAGEGFLNAQGPVSALVAGSMVTSITGALGTYFPVPGAYTAMALSFLVGSLFLFDRGIRRLALRLILFVFNSLTVFSVAVGLNTFGQQAFHPPPANQPLELERDVPTVPAPPPEDGFFRDWF